MFTVETIQLIASDRQCSLPTLPTLRLVAPNWRLLAATSKRPYNTSNQNGVAICESLFVPPPRPQIPLASFETQNPTPNTVMLRNFSGPTQVPLLPLPNAHTGVTKLVIVVNKMDDPSVLWSQERFDEVVTKLTPFLKQCGYNTKRDCVFLPVSGLMGYGIKVSLASSFLSATSSTFCERTPPPGVPT